MPRMNRQGCASIPSCLGFATSIRIAVARKAVPSVTGAAAPAGPAGVSLGIHCLPRTRHGRSACLGDGKRAVLARYIAGATA